MIARIKYDGGKVAVTGIFNDMKGLMKYGVRHVEHGTIEIWDNNTMTGEPIKTIERKGF